MYKNNILVLDGSWVMYPCIKTYEDISRAAWKAKNIWTIINMEREAKKHFSYDAEYLSIFYKLAVNAVKHGAEYHSYNNVLDFLEELKETGSKDTNITSISHYSGIEKMEAEATATPTNWISYALANSIIGKYAWVRNTNSIVVPQDLITEQTTLIPAYKGKMIDGSVFSDVVVVYDEFSVPYDYKHLFDMLVEVLKEVKV